MAKDKTNSPLLGYNTNVRHAGHLFHIQTEDSGVDHPHVITHLFTEGTILSSKKTAYDEHLSEPHWEDIVRQLMKDQHKSMFVELRDGMHDVIAEQILGHELDHTSGGKTRPVKPSPKGGFTVQGGENDAEVQEVASTVAAMAPAEMTTRESLSDSPAPSRGISIFDSPDANGTFGETLISDKSLDEVILNYLSDELEE
ncbi:MAG: hypothetical protein JXX29_00040 [Deltaproteobacteria bacterium]|nr:hypothetical protein [Deltaproteobacteria bacterium]MBN2670026.1 hypothetical protein [Deltaproteobacteria bacterium]